MYYTSKSLDPRLTSLFQKRTDPTSYVSVKAEEAIFIGYEKGTKNYKFWSPKQQRVVISSTATFDEFTFPFCAKKPDDKPPSLSIPDDSNDIQESDKSDKPKSSEDVLITYYYQCPPQEDEHPNPQIPPEQGPDDQQPSQPTTPDSNTESPPSYHSPSVPTTSHDAEELRHRTRICNPCILPNNTYGDRAPIDIERNIQI